MSYQRIYEPLTVVIEYKAPGGSWTYLTTESVTPDSAGNLSRTYYSPAGVAGVWEMRATVVSGTVTQNTPQTLQYINTNTIAGKTTSRYKRAYYFPLTGIGPWDIRVSRLTANGVSASLQNETWWDSLAELVESKLSYPNSAVIGAKIDAEQFNNIPSRGYEIYGLICQVPSNYNPVSRVYTGIWDGSFKNAHTDNPAWVYYDLITAKRYGLGRHVDVAAIDKWSLYEISQYCDELVPSGFGFMEPRFTCNLYIQTREDAYKVLSNLSSVFRGMSYWSSGQVTAVADMPSDPVAIFANANVIDGTFTYGGSSKKVRHTVALVTWNDPADMYRQKVEYVDDPEGILKYGINETEVIAFGCTSRGQAHRLGKWILYTERMESEVVTWKTGLESALVYPGAIVKVADNLRSGDRIGGRIISATESSVTLDSETVIKEGLVYTLSSVLPDGSVVDRTVSNAPGKHSVIDIAPVFPEVPQNNSMWVIASQNLNPQLFRVLSVTESDKIQAEITALQHDPRKFALIEQNISFDPVPTSSLSTTFPDPPMNLTAADTMFLQGPGLVGTKLHLSWESTAQRFDIQWRQNFENFKTVSSKTNSIDISPVVEGEINLRVQAIDSLGRRSTFSKLDYTVVGKTGKPGDVQGFKVLRTGTNLMLIWEPVLEIDLAGYEVRVGPSWDSGEVVIDKFSGTSTTHDQSEAGTYYYHIQSIDTTGNRSENVSTFKLVLDPPVAVSQFDAVQSNNRLEFRWNPNPETDIIGYEIREGLQWEASQLCGQVMATTYSIPSGTVGDRMFWIKAIASPGIYGATAAFIKTAVAQPTNFNEIWSENFKLNSFAGCLHDAFITPDGDLMMKTGASRSEFISSVDLGSQYRGQLSIMSAFDSVKSDLITSVPYVENQEAYDVGGNYVGNQLAYRSWKNSDFSWLSAAANSPWQSKGDINSVSIKSMIATNSGLRDAEMFGVRLNQPEDAIGGTPSGSGRSAYDSSGGRFGGGLRVDDLTSAKWSDMKIAGVFRKTFWFKPEVSADCVIATLRNPQGDYFLRVGYSKIKNKLYVTDGTNTDEFVFQLNVGEIVCIGLAQTVLTRKLYAATSDMSRVGNIEAQRTPVGSFTEMALY